MIKEIIYVTWPAVSFVAWFTGAAVLQTRARTQPLDWRLNVMLLLLTIVAFHFIAFTSIAANQENMRSVAIPLTDSALVLIALVGVKRRVRLTAGCFWMFSLTLIGGLAFWAWFINAVGGLFPK